MIETFDTEILLKVVVTIGVVEALWWIAIGIAFRMSRVAFLLFGAANLMFVGSLVLVALRGEAPDYLTLHGASGLLALSAMALRAGFQSHVDIPHTWRDLSLHLLVLALLVFVAPLDFASQPYLRAVATMSCFVTLIGSALELYPRLLKVLGRWSALGIVSPLLIFSALLVNAQVVPSILAVIVSSPQGLSLAATPDFLVVAIVALLWLNTSALGITIAERLVRIRELAERDLLTGVWSRRAIENFLDAERARAARTKAPFALVMADLDHFKRVNDTYGHAAGDAALKFAAGKIASALRQLDRLGRYGGEEFVVILPGSALAGACDAAERMRAALAAEPLPWEGKVIPITASFGVAVATTAGDDVEALFRRADAALYKAKAAGRNRVATQDETER